MLDLSIILTTHNRPQLLARAIYSTIPLLKKPGTEIVIIDDGDNLNSAEVVARISAKYGIKPSYIKRNDKPGLGRSRNYGLENSRGRKLVFLDDDDQINSEYYISVMDESSNESLLLYGDYQIVIENRDTGELLGAKKQDQSFHSQTKLEYMNYIPVGSYLIDRSLFLGYSWNEEIGTHEDYDFLLYASRFCTFKYRPGIACSIFSDVNRKGQMTAEKKIFQGLDHLSIYRKYPVQSEDIQMHRKDRLSLYGLQTRLF